MCGASLINEKLPMYLHLGVKLGSTNYRDDPMNDDESSLAKRLQSINEIESINDAEKWKQLFNKLLI